jgi:hypothetical protein
MHVSTLWRWSLRGVKGIRLETVMIGGIRYTSREALERFVARTTAAADGTTPTIRTPAQRQRAIEAAERELADSEILREGFSRFGPADRDLVAAKANLTELDT